MVEIPLKAMRKFMDVSIIKDPIGLKSSEQMLELDSIVGSEQCRKYKVDFDS